MDIIALNQEQTTTTTERLPSALCQSAVLRTLQKISVQICFRIEYSAVIWLRNINI